MLEIPKTLSHISGRGPAHRKGLKILVSGPPKTGKSYFLAHFPRPLVAFDCGEAGIQPYLRDDDIWFEITNPAAAKEAIQFVVKHEEEIASLVIDPVTTLWSDWLDHWTGVLEAEGKLNEGDQIHAGHWRRIKGPWKRSIFFPLQRAPFHVGLAAWPKDVEFSEQEVAPGVRTQLKVRHIEEAQVEKTLRFLYDIWFQTGVELDNLNRPTSKHWIRLAGGRRPLGVPPSEFYTGKVWRFDARKPEDPWKKIIEPWLESWQKSPAAVEHLGPRDPQEMEQTLRQMLKEEEESYVGQLVATIEKAETLAALRDLWTTITDEWDNLSEEHKAVLTKAKDRRKKELA